MRSAILELSGSFAEIIGYAFDATDNYVSDADHESLPSEGIMHLPSSLADLYGEIGEVSLPDVYNGYFIHPFDVLMRSGATGVPTRVESNIQAHVLTFGSDGGGGLFCLSKSDGVVYYLPTGLIEEGTYRGGMGSVSQVAPDLITFLFLLLDQVKEFALTGGVIPAFAAIS